MDSPSANFELAPSELVSGARRMRASILRVLAVLGTVGIATAAGCGDGFDRVEAGGTIVYNGAPVPNAVVTFLPETDGLTAEAITNQEGKFSLSSTGLSGTPAGKYRVRIVAVESRDVVTAEMSEEQKRESMMKAMFGRQSLPKYRIPRKYSDVETSGLIAEVTQDPEKNNFEFKLE